MLLGPVMGLELIPGLIPGPESETQLLRARAHRVLQAHRRRGLLNNARPVSVPQGRCASQAPHHGCDAGSLPTPLRSCLSMARSRRSRLRLAAELPACTAIIMASHQRSTVRVRTHTGATNCCRQAWTNPPVVIVVVVVVVVGCPAKCFLVSLMQDAVVNGSQTTD